MSSGKNANVPTFSIQCAMNLCAFFLHKTFTKLNVNKFIGITCKRQHSYLEPFVASPNSKMVSLLNYIMKVILMFKLPICILCRYCRNFDYVTDKAIGSWSWGGKQYFVSYRKLPTDGYLYTKKVIMEVQQVLPIAFRLVRV